MLIRENLSEIEHIQWEHWSKTVAKELNEVYKLLTPVIKDDRAKEARKIIGSRLDRWKKNWKPYRELTEEVKEFDREWADKVIYAFKYWLDKLHPPSYLYSSGGLDRQHSEETLKLILRELAEGKQEKVLIDFRVKCRNCGKPMHKASDYLETALFCSKCKLKATVQFEDTSIIKPLGVSADSSQT